MDKICTLCSSKHIHSLFEKESYSMLKCSECGVIYQFPQIDRRQHLNNMQEYFLTFDPFLRVASSKEILYRRFLNKVKSLKKRDSKILDIGCGVGYFLSLAKKDGWDAYGVEFVPDLAKKATDNYGLKVKNSTFEEVFFPDNYFDIITLWNVFEDFLNPGDALFKIKKILKPGGILFLRITNATYHSLIYKLNRHLKTRSFIKTLSEQRYVFHVFNYSSKTLRLLLSKFGFDNIKIKNSIAMAGDPYSVGKGTKILKKFLFPAMQFLYFLSCGKIMLASSIEVSARNAKN